MTPSQRTFHYYPAIILACLILYAASIAPSPPARAESCIAAAKNCYFKSNACQQLDCARQALSRNVCPGWSSEIRSIIRDKRRECEAWSRGEPSGDGWSKYSFNRFIEQLGGGADTAQGVDTSWERRQELKRQSRQAQRFLNQWRLGVTVGAAGIVAVPALFLVSWPWALGLGAAAAVGGYLSPDIFAAVTEPMFTN
jgi:hypothetical protein